MRRVTLPKDLGWADIREAGDLTMKERRILRSASTAAIGALNKLASVLPKDLPTDPKDRAAAMKKLDMAELGLSEKEADDLQGIQGASIVAGVAAWSLPQTLPTTSSVWEIKDEELFDFLANETSGIQSPEVDFSPNPDSDDPENPTGRRNGLNGRSSAKDRVPALAPQS